MDVFLVKKCLHLPTLPRSSNMKNLETALLARNGCNSLKVTEGLLTVWLMDVQVRYYQKVESPTKTATLYSGLINQF